MWIVIFILVLKESTRPARIEVSVQTTLALMSYGVGKQEFTGAKWRVLACGMTVTTKEGLDHLTDCIIFLTMTPHHHRLED
jgi:hypothetical protein